MRRRQQKGRGGSKVMSATKKVVRKIIQIGIKKLKKKLANKRMAVKANLESVIKPD